MYVEMVRESTVTPSQTGLPIWFGVETLRSVYDQQLSGKLSARAVQLAARAEGFPKLAHHAGRWQDASE